jgi:transcriptional regulator with XRE-family HTH domain
MLYINQIEKLKKQKKIANNEEIAKVIGRTRQATDKKMNGQTDFYVSELIKIADYCNIPITYFFEDSEKKKYADIDTVIDTLKEMIKERL